ncbi:hypothetical protein AB0K00_04175 [Dactylosporangium sp. NPDC049525]|uniref:hypothetical protein n=1 Tax=Dactylosporangium sp. NPDC049525 TaxID=3154730 RepID=UPI00343C6199
MSARHPAALGLTADRIDTTVTFWESYARLALSGEIRGNRSDLDELEAASALRRAGQWAMITDAARATNLLTRSGTLWHRHGHGFGTFLLATYAPTELSRTQMSERVAQLLRVLDRGPAATGVQQDAAVPDALQYPQQQAYLLMAAAADPRLGDGQRAELVAVASEAWQRGGTAPIGALGVPLRLYWTAALSLLQRDRDAAAQALSRSFGSLATAYNEAIESAMANTYLWQHTTSEVDVGNVDLVGLTVITARQHGTAFTREVVRGTAFVESPISRACFEIATEMADVVDDRPRERWSTDIAHRSDDGGDGDESLWRPER